MKRTTVFLDEGIERDLKALAVRKGEPAAVLMREALQDYIAREKAAAGGLSFIAMGRSGRSDTAETHEDLLFRDLEPHGGVPAAPVAKSRRKGTSRPAARPRAHP